MTLGSSDFGSSVLVGSVVNPVPDSPLVSLHPAMATIGDEVLNMVRQMQADLRANDEVVKHTVSDIAAAVRQRLQED